MDSLEDPPPPQKGKMREASVPRLPQLAQGMGGGRVGVGVGKECLLPGSQLAHPLCPAASHLEGKDWCQQQ